MRIFLLVFFLGLLTISCEENKKPLPTDQLAKGVWRGVLQISEQDAIPFIFEVVSNERLIIKNGEENIVVNDITVDSQSVSIKMPVFGSEFKLINKGNRLEGHWHNYNKKDYSIPFVATLGEDDRFDWEAQDDLNLHPRWKTVFSPNTEDSYDAIGLFDLKKGGGVTGTFLTETGDYRYLEGCFDGEQLQLSCFDGAHAFLFKAELNENGILAGDFWSGKHWHERWLAEPNEDFQLAKMDSLTFLKEGYEKIAFRLPDENGDTISLEDERFVGQPTIVQITGTWCPNCMDETRFLVEVYEEYKDKGLEVIAIDFEAIDDFEVFQRNVKRIRKDLGVNYPVVYGGHAKKEVAAETLPMLNHIMSYPTAIFINKKGEVQAIHTGFSGPGAGELYEHYVKKTLRLVEELVFQS